MGMKLGVFPTPGVAPDWSALGQVDATPGIVFSTPRLASTRNKLSSLNPATTH